MKIKAIGFVILLFAQYIVLGQAAASWNYNTQTGPLGTTYSWIDCSAGANIVSGDDTQSPISWPFNFKFYDNNYTTSNVLSVATNGFIRLDGVADGANYTAAQNYTLSSTSTELGQIIATGVYDDYVGRTATSWVRSLVSGTAPNRIFTIEYNNIEINYNAGLYANIQVSFYESVNKVVLKFGNDNVTVSGADLGIHSGVANYFHKWQEVQSGTNNTWIEYSAPNIEVNATVGILTANYPSLKGAFDKINDGTHQGNITIKLKSGTTEGLSAILNASGTGGSNYSSVNIYPTITGLSITGNLATPLIDLNGAANVTIDGRVNATGATKDLSIVNSSTSSVAGTSTIRFINGANNNTVKYSTIKGSETLATSGVLFFSTTTAGSGNSTNTIDKNDITNAADVNRPVNAIYSAGTAGKENSGNIISNNAIYDFLKHATASNGIYLTTSTTDCTIDGNSFYETAAFISTGAVTFNAIYINNTTGNNFTVSNNYIGGNSALCGGIPWTKTNAANNVFNAININVGTTTASSIQNNTIQNINWSNSANAAWIAVAIAGGNVSIGTTTGNTIGAATGIGSVTVTGATSGLNVYGIYITSTGMVDCQNNTIGSITSANGTTLASNIYGINKSAVAGTVIISKNKIGSTTTVYSINASSASTANAQVVYGIYNAGTGTITISNNTISKLNNGTTNTTVGTLGFINGITSLNGIITIANNTIYDLSIANSNTNTTSSASVCGMALTGTANAKTISGNTIYNLTNTYVSFAGNVIGLYFAGGTSANTVSENFIYSLSVTGATSTAASVYGIKTATGVTTYSNNIINLGGNTPTTVYGIYETGAANNNNNLYFNTVYIGGSLTSGSTNKSYAIYSAVSTNVRDFRNNIFVNARSTAAGANLHYAAYFNYTISTNITLNYNDYFVLNTGGIIGYWNGANKTTLPIITGQDANSLAINPNFTTPGGTNSSDYITTAALTGVFGTGILTDYRGITRNNPSKMGALESSLDFVWQGNTSTNFATATNWQNGVVPADGADISFAVTPANDCYLDQNRTLKNITNTSSKKLVINGKQFTLTGNLISATANQIDASNTSSVIVFAGTVAQSIPAGALVSNSIDGLTVNNSSGLTQNGALAIQTILTLTNGAFTVGANTLTLNGSISTSAGTLTGGSTSNISIGGSGASTTLPGVSLNNLTLNRSNGISLGGNVSVAGTLLLTSGTLTVGANTLTISGNAPARTSGNIDAGNAGASLVFTNSSVILLPATVFTGNVNNLTVNGAGITSSGDLTVNGILNLQSANPSSVKGSLDMSTFTLNMGASATTTGIGDVTGIIKRTSFAPNTSYSFGNQFTTMTIAAGGTMPDDLSFKITLGAAPSWKTIAVQRNYDIVRTGGANTKVTLQLHYLDSELQANTELNLIIWDYHSTGPVVEEHGKSSQNTTDNWVNISNRSITYFATAFNDHMWGLSNKESVNFVWQGTPSSDWNDINNWSSGAVPDATSDVIIPDAATTQHDPVLPLSPAATVKTIRIMANGLLEGSTSTTLTVAGNVGAWLNEGNFNAGTSTVRFTNANATMADPTNFFNLTVADGASLTPGTNNIMRIAGALTLEGTGILRAALLPNTIEFNGTNQTIINPNGLTPGYYNLILSGSGTKTMPGTALNIADDFILTGTATATAASALTIGGELEIQAGATFATGAYDHTVAGHFDNSGTFTATTGTTITLNGTAMQNIYGGSVINFERLKIDNTSGVSLFTGITVNDLLTLTNGNLNVGTTTLTINGGLVKTSGYIDVNPLSSLTFRGTTGLTLPGSLFLATPSINNLTVNRTGGVIAGSDFTVNGILNLQSANPSATIGSFSTGNYTLNMGATATTTGAGDVTGKVKRTTILPNIEYTFGNQFSSVTFPNIGTLPTEITLKISIGTVPTWKTDGIKRVYDISQIGGNGTKAIIKSHYLDSELNGNIEINLSFFSYIFPSSTLLDRGLTQINTTDNWITLNNADFGNLAPVFGVIEHGFGVSTSNVITWDGSESTDWLDPYNWTPAYSPGATKTVIIPDAATTPNDPIIAVSSSSSVKSLSIQSGGILSAGAGSQLTVVGTSGAWSNSGTFNAGTGKVIFNSGIPTEIVTIAGTTDFYNIEVGANTTMQPVVGSILRIAGTGTADVTSQVDFSTVNNTVEWNGADQTIVNPNGIAGNSGYYNLVLSGSGTKTMPNTPMNIKGNFSASGTVSGTAAGVLVISGNTLIGNGSAFITGSFNHLLAGNFENNGTFTGTSGGTITFNGTTAQTISGTSTSSFNNLTINNILNVTQAANVNVNNVLLLSGGNLIVGNTTLGLNGTISNISGAIEVSTSSNFSFGGTSTLTINNNLFSSTPSINNLTINRTGGVTLGNQSMTVNGVLNLQAGTLILAANSLTMAGNTLTRTTGNIDAGNTSATLAFTNSAAITLPAFVITGNINNTTVNGAGINAGGDITINGVLSLLSANQSATVGSLDMGAYTLNMGASATTTGIGDVTGIVKRQHTFLDGIEYSFGNHYTSLDFLGVPGGVKPSWVSCKIVIGAAPTWRSEAINRFYSFAQSGGTDRMIVKLHYLDSELHGTESDETQLVFWDAYDAALAPNNFVKFYPRNKNGNDAANNWVQLTGPAINYLATSSFLDVKQWGLSYNNVSVHTWIGLGSVSYPGDWSLPGHWDGGVPQAGDDVVIPTTLPTGSSGYPYRNLLSTIAPSAAKSINIETGASLSVTDFDITVYGDGNAWVNNGTFNAGTGNVIFANGILTNTVTINGTTNFNNLKITDKTHLHQGINSITRVAGMLNANSGSAVDFTTNPNTVEYNGDIGQTVINPTGDANPGYHNLILSGSGTKTLPASSLNIEGDLTTNATVSASGNTLVINGSSSQSISGTVTPVLNNLTISNTTAAVTAAVNLDCSGNFTNSGDFDMTTYALAVASTVTNSGTVRTASVSATPLPSGKAWGGTLQYYTTTGGQTVMAGTYNNLTLSNTSGTQMASGNVTVNSTLITTSGGLLNMGINQLIGTLSTITNGGTIQTQNTSATPVPIGKTWGGTVQYNSATGGQIAMAGTYNILTLSNTSGTQTASGDITATTFNTTAGGTVNMGINALTLTNLSHLGILRTQNTSSTPFTSGKTWGGTVVFDGTSGQTLPTPASTFNNLTIGNTTGITAAANQTMNGILNLSVANPNATHGSLDMATYTLNLGADANTTGIGDVNGIMTRTSFTTNKIYTYGNTNQYVFFPVAAGQTLPTSFTLRVTLLATAPDWVSNATKRLYEIAQSGGVNTKAIFRANYLDSELASGVNESLLSFWQDVYPFGGANILERGWSNYDVAENWITFSDANFGLIPGTLGYFKVIIAPTQFELRTWNGSQGTTNWNTATNWTPQGVPTSSLGIIIPTVSSSNNYSPDLPVGATGKYILIQNSGILNAATGATFTLSGNGNVWSTEAGGLFNPGNSVVTFDGDNSAGIVATAGHTDFYDLTISANTTFRPGVNSYLGIAGTLTNNGVLDAAAIHNTIEFKENASLTIPNPNGSTPGYHTLIISGTGTKTLPTPLDIWHDFTNNGTVETGTGLVKINGNYSLQTIGGSSTTNFYDLTIDNTLGTIATAANITAGHTLTINAGAILQPGAGNTIGGAGTLTGSGTAKVTRIAATPDMATQYPISTKTLTNLTVDYCGTSDQTVSTGNYGSLVISPNGTRNITLASTGTIGVSGVFNPDLTTTTYTITGSTLEANGTGSQFVPAFNYYNVNVTGDRGGGTITLVNGGTIGIAGHSTVSATNANFVINNNTIDINGSEAQTIDPFSFYNVIFSNSGTKTTTGNLVVYVGFTVNSGSTLDMAAFTLSGPMSSINNNGTIKTSNTSGAPIPTGKTWGGTIEYTGSAAQTVVAGIYNNLTMSGAGGGTAAGDNTVNGILNLSHANPLSTQGILHTGSNTLSMGASATTTGAGDVTGIVKRQHTFANNVEYSFGNQYTSLNFLGVPGGVKPTWISCKIQIGTVPTWRSEAIRRFYSFAQSGGTDRMIVKLHYLDSELHDSETDETQLVFWDAYDPALAPNNFVNFYPRNKNGNNATSNWVQLTGPAINYLATSSTLDVKQWGLSYNNAAVHTWIGLGSVSYPGDWSLPGHWSGGVPQASDDVLIPTTLPAGNSGYPYRNLLPSISPASAKTIEIEPGATLNVNDYNITISGDANAWVNNGTFNAGTGTVIFNNGSTTNAATLAGTTNFYDLTVSDNTKVQPAASSISRIAGTFTAGAGSILDFAASASTIEYNGNNAQTVIDPGASYGYYNLIFSDNGTKILPSSTLNILGDLTMNSAITATGNTLAMKGVTSQIINGTNPATLSNLTIDNAAGVTLASDALATVSGTLLINSGKIFDVSSASQLTVLGTLTNNAGETGFVLQSDERGTASLLHNTDNVPVTVERYIKGSSEAWHFLSSPVAAQAISGSWLPSGTYGNGTGYDLYLWNEPNNCWIYKLNTTATINWSSVHPGGNFMIGRGYLYSLQATNPTKEFIGNLNNGPINYGLTISSTDATLKGFNLVGNPYPSTIDWSAASGWTRSDLVNSGNGYDMWIWDQTVGNYGVFNSFTGIGTNGVTRYIPPMQGFFVQASSAGSLSLANAVRVHDNASDWKNAQINPELFSIIVNSGTDNSSDEALLLFGYSRNQVGAAKLFSQVVTAPSLYLPSGNTYHSVRYLTDTIDNPTVPIMFKAGRDGNYSLKCNFDADRFEIVLLEDRQTHYIQDLKRAQTYLFTASKTNEVNRFVLHFRPVTNQTNNELPANIFTDGTNIIIDLLSVQAETEVFIYDEMGRTLLQQKLQGAIKHTLNFKGGSQFLIVCLKNQDGSLCRKLLWRRN